MKVTVVFCVFCLLALPVILGINADQHGYELNAEGAWKGMETQVKSDSNLLPKALTWIGVLVIGIGVPGALVANSLSKVGPGREDRARINTIIKKDGLQYGGDAYWTCPEEDRTVWSYREQKFIPLSQYDESRDGI